MTSFTKDVVNPETGRTEKKKYLIANPYIASSDNDGKVSVFSSYDAAAEWVESVQNVASDLIDRMGGGNQDTGTETGGYTCAPG